ncbi:hypothetical protein EUGRSUZ_L02683 [Eucalyptus grandis]|uniref:NAC domain-containing protein n=1 Tax=Eucalyptus grandis TaxID=71139 RepID=A0AAD9WIE0_EUCGR|nr:hypothetical protein EUGRSUZ_L02683 [Eucalyptus grandis]
MGLNRFQVGFRFLPTEEELLNGYLTSKVLGYVDGCVIPELDDFYAWDPWDLPGLYQQISNIPSDGLDWYFFCPSPYLAQNSERVKRQTRSGKWKITSQKDEIKARDTKALIGTKRILVFYKGHAETGWVMHEYHLNPKLLNGYSSTFQIPYILCRLKRKPSESLDISPSFEGGSSVVYDTPVASQRELTENSIQEVSTSKDRTSVQDFASQVSPVSINLLLAENFGVVREFFNMRVFCPMSVIISSNCGITPSISDARRQLAGLQLVWLFPSAAPLVRRWPGTVHKADCFNHLAKQIDRSVIPNLN